MQPSGLHLRLVVPGNVRHNSGGNVYNAALARELTLQGVEVETCPLDGDWPGGSPEDRRRLAAVLGTDGLHSDGLHPDGGSGASHRVTLVDGLLAGGAPEELAAAAAAGRPAWILLHMPLEDPGLERRALREAAGVICTSSSAAAGLRARHGLAGITVALPGTVSAPLASGSEPPHLLAMAALLPNKDQSLLLDALSLLTELPWTAALVGSDSADPAYAAQLRDTVRRLGLQDRVSIPGELRGGALEAEWASADLSLLISRAETYGLVVPESIARGVPVVVRAGTGAVEALAAGTPQSRKPDTLPGAPAAGAGTLPGTAVALAADPSPLAEILHRWLTDTALRTRWQSAAVAARNHLPGWDSTARTVVEALRAGSAGNPGSNPGTSQGSGPGSGPGEPPADQPGGTAAGR
ncbi:glycosyltransferase involved in cell wall biosynthesis [Arthrobacter sp. V4I6]|uniref:glycosyltransferase n=1 Tax=unclassified Arthrobacter TaxID=235627 RepID=UPI00278791A0|nr:MULTISPECIES: glycosyltransferase [unclassified Arthrobacter]MDQ0822787.1 glycosyltransferase involved in cell wall biosynthesis [Arthrobacter sp. V1I7]MDQ0852416.1 glycosyltransferase involved in cell wall biosynthesis [Arthrobacter sp. V4I6]